MTLFPVIFQRGITAFRTYYDMPSTREIMPNTQHGAFLMVIQILCSISLPKSSCACLEYNPPANTNMYILGAETLVTMGTKQDCLHTQIT